MFVCGTVAWHGVRVGRAAQELPDAAPSQAPEGRLLALWVALAACPSILLMAVTSHLTKNVAPIPFLWVLPLGLYLLSFILCFEEAIIFFRGTQGERRVRTGHARSLNG